MWNSILHTQASPAPTRLPSAKGSIVRREHILHIHSSLHRHLGCFHILAIVNDAAMDVAVQIPPPDLAFNSFVASLLKHRLQDDSYGKEWLELLVFLFNTFKFKAWSRRGHCHLEGQSQFSGSNQDALKYFQWYLENGNEACHMRFPGIKERGEGGGARRNGSRGEVAGGCPYLPPTDRTSLWQIPEARTLEHWSPAHTSFYTRSCDVWVFLHITKQ